MARAKMPTVRKRFMIVLRPVVRMAATSSISQGWKVGWGNAPENSGSIDTLWTSLSA